MESEDRQKLMEAVRIIQGITSSNLAVDFKSDNQPKSTMHSIRGIRNRRVTTLNVVLIEDLDLYEKKDLRGI